MPSFCSDGLIKKNWWGENENLDLEKLLNSKLIEQVEELTDAIDKEDIADEASKVLYFLLVKSRLQTLV